MFDTAHRKTVLILGLSLALVLALLALVFEPGVRETLGPLFYILGLAITGCVLLVLAGYVWNQALIKGLKTLQETARHTPDTDPPAPQEENEPDEIIGLARKIEQMARNLQKIEASYRGIVEDQTDLICRYRPDGRLTFVNGAYARAFGRKRIDLIGQPFPLLDAAGQPSPADNLTHEQALHHADGRTRWLAWRGHAIKDDTGRTLEYQAVGHDITERKHAEAVLRREKEIAEAADRAKSEFFAVISHEIRTPIGGITGFADMLSQTPLTGEQHEIVNLIRTSGHTLGTLVTDILDFSKIESGRIELESTPFSPRECVEEVCAFFAPKVRIANLALTREIADEVPQSVRGDRHRLRQILTNLVANAVKFTPRGGVVVTLSSTPETRPADSPPTVRLRFTVSDTGIGIPPATMERLFLPFSQVDISPQRRREGTGLGLAISKRLCELMGGGISAESTPGAGSIFRFDVRCDLPAPAGGR